MSSKDQRFPPRSSYAPIAQSPSYADDGGDDESSSPPLGAARWARSNGKGRFRPGTFHLVVALSVLFLVGALWRLSPAREELQTEVAVAPDVLAEEGTTLGSTEWQGVPEDEEPAPVVDEAPATAYPDKLEEVAEPAAEEATLEPPPRTATFDLSHCTEGAEPCRFLLPGYIGGQETRGQEHIYRLGLLTLALDRILVLPNASHSELGACLPRGFEFYYDVASLAAFGISTVTQAEFTEWTLSRLTPPTGQRIILQRRGSRKPDTNEANATPPEIEVGGPVALRAKVAAEVTCLDEMRIDYSGFEHLGFYGRFADSQTSGTMFVESFIKTIRDSVGYIPSTTSTEETDDDVPGSPSSTLVTTPDVLTFPTLAPWWTTTNGRLGVDLRVISELNPNALAPSVTFSHLAYAPAWTSAAAFLASSLSPFIAIHWRTEQLKLTNFAPCTHSLIATLTDMKRENPDLTTVYLLTDYPIESLRDPSHKGEVEAHSGSYGTISQEAHQSMKELVEWFEQGGEGLKLTTWTEQEGKVDFGEETRKLLPVGTRLRDLDLSLIGMLDKSVAMHAQLFVAGSQNECGKRSSYTASVVLERQELIGAQGVADTTVWNDVRYFGLPLKNPKKGGSKKVPNRIR